MNEKITYLINNRNKKQSHEDTLFWFEICIAECMRNKNKILKILKELNKRIKDLEKERDLQLEEYEKEYGEININD